MRKGSYGVAVVASIAALGACGSGAPRSAAENSRSAGVMIRESFTSLQDAARGDDARSFCGLIWPIPSGNPVVGDDVRGDGTARGRKHALAVERGCEREAAQFVESTKHALRQYARVFGKASVSRVVRTSRYMAAVFIHGGVPNRTAPLKCALIVGKWRFLIQG